MSGWVELGLRVAEAHYAAVEALLEEAGALAITRDAGDRAVFDEPGLAVGAAWAEATVTALFEAHADVVAIEARLRATLGATTVITRTAVAEQPWHEVWKQSWQPQLYAGGLCVCPTWCTPPPQATRIVRLDPGGAFGTGTHETTALCLDWLASAPNLAGARVLDYGCGSGILAIAAALLGAARVTAVDIDPAALAVARSNAQLNGVADRIVVGAPDRRAQSCDILLANILLAPLLNLAPTFATLLEAGGTLVLSGLLEAQVARVLEAYDAGFTMAPPVTRGEWALLAGRKRSP